MSAQPSVTPRSIAKSGPRLLFATLLLGQMSQSLAYTVFVAALPQMAADLGPRGTFVAQMTMALAALGMMFGAIASGWILEKAGTRMTLLTSVLTFAVTGAGGLFLRNPPLLLGSRFILGFASACMATTCLWGIAAEYAGDRRARVLGISAAISNIAALSSTLLGGYIAQRSGWPMTFLQYPVFGLVGFVLAFVSLRQAKPERQDSGEAVQPFLGRLLPFYLLVVLLFAVMFMASTQLAFVLEENGIRNPADRSWYMGAVTVIAAATSFAYGWLQARLTVLGAFAFAVLCMSVAAGVIGSGSSPAPMIIGASLIGIYVGVLGPYVYHVVTEHTDAFSRSRAIGLLSAFGFLGGFLNPVIFATLSDAIGLRNVFYVVSLLMALLAAGTLVRVIRQRSAAKERTI